MKIRCLLIFVFAAILAVATVTAQPGKKMAFSGTEYFNPLGLPGLPQIGHLLDPGTVACPGYEPTGDPIQPCPEGSRIRLRNAKWVSRFESSTSSSLSGWMTVEANANLDASGLGPIWGTFSLAMDGGGTLNGPWQTVQEKAGDYWVATLHSVGHVTGGPLDGAQASLTDAIVKPTIIPIAYIGAVNGTLLYPHGN